MTVCASQRDPPSLSPGRLDYALDSLGPDASPRRGGAAPIGLVVRLPNGRVYPMLALRQFVEADFEYLIKRWHETNIVSYPYSPEHQRHSLQGAATFFRHRVLPRCDVWIAERGTSLCGLMAIRAPWIDQLTVFPEYQRSGIGTALLRKARECSPQELRLYTFQRNRSAHAFYEHHGFIAIAFGVSPPPESEPDVEYRWVA